MREENPFEEQEIAEQWITAVETPQKRSREKEFFPYINKWSKQFGSGTIVEVGCGQGICSLNIDSERMKYVGIEPSPFLLERAKSLYSNANREFKEGSSYNIPLNDAIAVGAFSLGVWFHVENLDRAHKEVCRILKKDGKLLIITSNPDEQKTWESFFENPVVDGKKIVGKVKVPGGVMSKNILYIHSRKELSDSLEKNGFKVDSTQEVGFGGGERRRGIFIAINATKI